MGEVIGYARVSTTGQSLEAQEQRLRDAGCTRIFAEKLSGRDADRPELATAVAWAREGDVLVVTRLDRLARDIRHLLSVIAKLGEKGVGFRCLDQSGVDTTRPEGRLMLNLLASFAEFEADLIAERQRDGIARAKAEGKYKGRKAAADPAEVRRMKAEGMNHSQIAAALNISRPSVLRALARDP